MDEETRATLGRINRDFYERTAAEFSATREHPWPGWQRVLRHATSKAAPGAKSQTPPEGRDEGERTLRVLDAGCGNGRLAAFLCAHTDRPLRYVGIDASEALLALARARALPSPAVRFDAGDLQATAPLPDDHRFDLVCAFGVLHCVPGRAARRKLLAWLASRLAANGLLAVTFWRFGERDWLERHATTWDAYNASAAQSVDVAALEPGDHLLRWGDGNGPPRYGHLADAAEITALVAELVDGPRRLRVEAEYHADGKHGDQNHYALLRAPAAGSRAGQPNR